MSRAGSSDEEGSDDQGEYEYASAAIEGAVSLARIFDHWDTVLIRDPDYRTHVSRHAIQMDRNNRFGPLCDRFVEAIGV